MIPEPVMSFVLVTDTYETIRPVVRAIAAQTIAERLEVVLVGPEAALPRVQPGDLAGFAGHRVVGVPSILPLAAARAVGVRATTGRLVNVGETHAFPHPEFAATVVAAMDAGSTAVVPGFHNGNPGSALSWANFLLDYGRWNAAVPPGEPAFFPAYHTTFTRAFLLGLGEGLDRAYAVGNDIGVALRAGGHRVAFVPAAGIRHVNVSRPLHWLRERYLTARCQAATRSAPWSRGRRAVYVAGSPLIPAVLLARLAPALRDLRREQRPPRGTMPGLLLATVAREVGEVAGFVAGASPAVHERSERYEVHKLRFIRPGSFMPWPASPADARATSSPAAR